ncbi:hypothetical protein [Lentzea waywayandensis]|uniref:hypothetical protein n=1 Tax=Lentzea waywayandensis TaxID=84724 RepID=UPI001FE27131|nr:hypothetical protein [Lentzea waywayandensis]
MDTMAASSGGNAQGRAQPGDHVVSGLTSFRFNEAHAVAEEVAEALLRDGPVGDVRGGLGPRAELAAVVVGHTEKFADHQDLERECDRCVQVGWRF